MNPEQAEKVRAKYIAPVSESELACRILEAMAGCELGAPLPRPDGMTPEQALDACDPMMAEMARHGERAAMVYWAECIATANTVQ